MNNSRSTFPYISRAISIPLACALGVALCLPARVAVADTASAQRFDQQMQPVLASYLKIATALAADSTNGVTPASEAIAKQAAKLDAESLTGEHAAHHKDLPAKLRKAAQALSKAATLEEARKSFKQLSMPMAMWVTMSKPKHVHVLYCSMAKASWVQKHGDVRNPYFGSKMSTCGEVVGGDTAKDKHSH